jgi:ATPase subunit of ABC transporter with duplicated ATPase domains
MLNISDVTVRLGGRTIIDRASAALPTGARVGLVGRNGAGKSTLVKAIIGEIEPDDGSIDMPRRARLGYIAQEAPQAPRRRLKPCWPPIRNAPRCWRRPRLRPIPTVWAMCMTG